MLKLQEEAKPAPVAATPAPEAATPAETAASALAASPTEVGSVGITPTRTAKASPQFVTVPRWVGLAVVGVMLIALVPRTADWYLYWFFTPVDGKPAWTYWIASLTGFLAFIAFIYTHIQRERHFRDAELAKQNQFNVAELAKREQFNEAEFTRLAISATSELAKQSQFELSELAKQVQFNNAQANALRLATEKQEQERFHFERRELQAEFADIQNRFEKENISIRANAALRLADFAQRIDPAKEPTPTNPDRPPRNAANNPYFLSVASQLTTALYLEKDDAVRKAIGDALRTLTNFAKEKNADDEEPQLLYDLIERLKGANAAAKTRFVEAMAAWAIVQRTSGILGEEDVAFLATVTAFDSATFRL